MTAAIRIRVRGQVQGVGFRPFVWRLARQHMLTGWVANDGQGVLIHAEGDPAPLDRLVNGLRRDAPPIASIDEIDVQAAPREDHATFAIMPSRGTGADTRIAPDLATCPDCLDELAGAGRRAGYAFTNCTNCGPRYSIVTGIPYDRAQTTMAGFAMCAACAAEYDDPADRRFHAQPIACPDCGPRLSQPIAAAAQVIAGGGLVALKGLGGFHLACDASDAGAVAKLRRRKARPTKPLAVMGSLAMIRDHADLSDAEAEALSGPAAPILLLGARAGGRALAPGIAPGLDRIGWMLPATPLHHLLIAAVGRPLVMTSANPSGRPMLTRHEQALDELADLVLDHDRPIARRVDDSVAQLVAGHLRLHRRARGFAPRPIRLHPGFAAAPPVIAFGGHLKAALCLTRGGEAVLSQHLGDLDDAETVAEYLRAKADLTALLDHRPALAVCDLHPGYRTTAFADDAGLPLVRVAHHHAHMAACMAENGLGPGEGPVSAIVLDGLGMGPDGALRGGELWLGGYAEARIVGGLVAVPLPGGDAAGREPWRNLLAQLDAAGLGARADALLDGRPLAALRRAVAAGVNAPLCSSAGRLFDAMAAALGIAPERQSYEGEAAMRLESLARRWQGAPPEMGFGLEAGRIDPVPMWKETFHLLDRDTDPAAIALGFHHALARSFAAVALSTGAPVIALSGGCFHNALLTDALLAALRAGFSESADSIPKNTNMDSDVPRVILHRETPAGDGALALGQAAVASARALAGG